MISAKAHPKKKIKIHGKTMAYVEMGNPDKPPIIFLHGNPTSSYLWRNIMPIVKEAGWCLAPDLIGMGNSDKLANSIYDFETHRHYLDGWFDEMGLSRDIRLVVHDWGSALGFHWARRHPNQVTGICYMEAIVRPFESWDEFPEIARPVFQGFRSEEGEDMVLEKNIFVETVLPGSVLRDLTQEEMAIYRAPFQKEGEDRRPTLTWPRQIPIAGKPANVVKIARDYAQWMSENNIPKLFINAEPGAILTPPLKQFCRQWKNQTEITVKGSHFVQEDSPKAIGTAIKNWLNKIAKQS